MPAKVRQIWNVSPHTLALDMTKPGIRSCRSTFVDAEVAEQLVKGPDWSFDNPRQPVKRRVERLVVIDSVAEMIAEGSPVNDILAATEEEGM